MFFCSMLFMIPPFANLSIVSNIGSSVQAGKNQMIHEDCEAAKCILSLGTLCWCAKCQSTTTLLGRLCVCTKRHFGRLSSSMKSHVAAVCIVSFKGACKRSRDSVPSSLAYARIQSQPIAARMVAGPLTVKPMTFVPIWQSGPQKQGQGPCSQYYLSLYFGAV